MGKLKGKTVLISDASSPSGKAVAKAFADEGAKLALNYCDKTEVKGFGEYCYDLTDKSAVDALVRDVTQNHDRIDVLIHNNNYIEPLSILDSTDTQIMKAFDLNAKSAFLLTQSVGNCMKGQKSGSIVYISSIHADKPSGSSFAYSMAKAAVGMLCKEAVLNLGSYGIRANVIEMGPVEGETEIFESDISRLYDNLHLKLNMQPAGTWEQAARLAVFMSDGNCPFINGQSIKLDGGFLLNFGYKYNYEELVEAEKQRKRFVSMAYSAQQHFESTGNPDTDLTGKTAIITGAATGVGQGMAVVLAARGMNLVLTRNNVAADKTMEMIRNIGGKAVDVSCNVCDDESVARLVSIAKDSYGGLDVLINNAMIQPNRLLLEYSSEEYDKVINVNAMGYIRCIRHAAPLLAQSESGRVINISSIHALRPCEFDPAYSMTKAAINMLTREAAIELGVHGITANTITLGAIRVARRPGDHNFKPHKSVEHRKMPYGFFLSGRHGITDDAGHIAAFLASEGSRFITGASIRADGGCMMAFY